MLACTFDQRSHRSQYVQNRILIGFMSSYLLVYDSDGGFFLQLPPTLTSLPLSNESLRSACHLSRIPPVLVEILFCLSCCLCFVKYRTLLQGDKEGGFSIFWADDGLDTGPILLQRKTAVDANDTVDSLYNRFLYPEGIKSMVRIFDMM